MDIGSVAMKAALEAQRIKREAEALLTQGRADNAASVQALNAQAAGIREQNQAAEQSAVNALMEQMQQRAQQAELASQAAPKAPTPVMSGAPLKQITGVSLTPELAGQNAATAQFFIAPEATQSQFDVGTPVPGAGIGQRQKPSTRALTPNPDSFNTDRKGQF